MKIRPVGVDLLLAEWRDQPLWRS